MERKEDASDSDGPIVDDNVIRIQLRKPCQKKWELRTRNLCPNLKFPTIQLFDYDGNLLIETNDENVSIKSYRCGDLRLKSSQSLKEKIYRNVLDKSAVRKHNSSGNIIYTRVFKTPVSDETNTSNGYVVRNTRSVSNIPINNTLQMEPHNFGANSIDLSRSASDLCSDISSVKSTDNESPVESKEIFVTSNAGTLLMIPDTQISSKRKCRETVSETKTVQNVNQIEVKSENQITNSKDGPVTAILQKSISFHTALNPFAEIDLERTDNLPRSKSGIVYKQPRNKISFLDTYLKSLPVRTQSNPDWFPLRHRSTTRSIEVVREPIKLCEPSKPKPGKAWRFGKIWANTLENDSLNKASDVAAACEFKKRLKIYRRGISELSYINRNSKMPKNRRHSDCECIPLSNNTSSSESLDEADVVLNRLRRRIFKNKLREKRKLSEPCKTWPKLVRVVDEKRTSDGAGGLARVTARAMGSNISQHSSKGLKGRRARSSGDLCNGDSKSQTESSVSGSVVGDVMGWNRSLPNHLDGNRHLADYSRVNNYEFSTYNRCHPKAGRGLRYRVSKSGSELEPVWKLQDPGCDQGYGSERSPEEDFVPPLQPTICYEEYEAELRTIYPFITDENTFTVVVEKDGRGLGMSVCGGGGLVRIRRLYPPQPAWRTGRLAPRDILLAANGVPLAGLSTYEALEVLRTVTPRVELRVCRPPPDLAQSVTPPDPPTPPVRTPHPPAPLDPLNCHPMHARLSQTTSSATTSSSEGRGKRDASPESERQELRLPDLEQPLPVYDVQYGEFDIVMTKVNGSLGFTLRKEDHSALGHYVRALVREPALSDGRIQPGDRIVAVNDTPMSNMSHSEAVAFLRACEPEVRLRLYRDHAATPLSPTSPRDDGHTDSDGGLTCVRPKPPLRPEAVSMLCDLAARRLTPDAGDAPRSPCLSPRKFRKLTKDTHYEQQDGPYTVECVPEVRSETDRRAPFTLGSPPPSTSRKQKLSLTVASHGYELNNLNNEALDAPNVYQEDMTRYKPTFPDTDEPVSMPVDLSSDEARFAHTNPAYQSAVIITDTASASEGHKDDGNGLKKWKGVTLSPDNERKSKLETKSKEEDAIQKENVKPDTKNQGTSSEPTIVSVELNRGWNSRLGFSVQSHPESGQSYISAVYSDSVAARDGRLRRGDVILQVNDENVTSMKTPEVIDLLRILRGSICITVLRPPNP